MLLGKQKSARKLKKEEITFLLFYTADEETQTAFIKRLDYICGKTMELLGVNVDSNHTSNIWCINNFSPEHDDFVGYFDAHKHQSHIGIQFLLPETSKTDLFNFALKNLQYLNKIPTSWLHQDFEKTLENSINEMIEKKKEYDSKIKVYEDTVKRILSKLSEDEQKLITIKNFSSHLIA